MQDETVKSAEMIRPLKVLKLYLGWYPVIYGVARNTCTTVCHGTLKQSPLFQYL
jgi:hypothetical protein